LNPASSFRSRKQTTNQTAKTMKISLVPVLTIFASALVSCNTAATNTAATGTANTVGHAAQGVGRTARTAGTGIAKTVGSTATTAGSGIAEGDLKKSTVGTVKTAGKGTASTAVGAGRSHLKTSSGVIKDTGKTIKDTDKAASGE
jgi:hypothetical protein